MGATRFFSQLRLLLWKNLLLSYRGRKQTALQLLSPVLFLALLAACSQIIVARDDISPVHRTAPSLTRCHSPLGACTTLLWAVDPPASASDPPRALSDAAVARVIDTVLRNNGLKASDAYRAASGRAVRDRVLAQPNTTLAGVVFYPIDAPSNPNVSPGTVPVPFALLYNETNPNDLTHVQVFEALSYHVEQALVLELGGQNVSAASPQFTNSRFPVVQKVRKFDAISNVGTLVLYCPTMFNFMLLLYQLVQEKEMQLRRQMKSVGMSTIAYWGSYFIYNFGFVILSSLITMLFGATFQFAFFIKASWPAVFLTFILFGFSMTPIAVFLSMLIGATHAAVNAGMAVFLFGVVVQIIATNPWVLQQFYNPDFPSAILKLLRIWPPFNFSKLIIDIASKTNENEFHTKGATFFSWDDVYRETPMGKDFLYPAPVDSLKWLIIDTAIFFGVCVVLYNLLPSEGGMIVSYIRRRMTIHQTEVDARSKSIKLDVLADDDVRAEVHDATSGHSTAAIQLRHMSKTYHTGVIRKKHVHAVVDLSMTVKENEIVALLGHNGCGKSTTMNALSCVINPTGGDAIVFGKSIVNEPSDVREMIGVCPQDDVLWPDLSAIEHLKIFGLLKGMSPSELEAEVKQRLEDVGLWNVGWRAAGTFSGGMKRRLTVAISCIGNPRFLLLDEPTTGLDPVARRQLWASLQRLRNGRAILLTTHSMEEAEALGDRVAIMVSGNIRSIGAPLRLKARYGVGYLLNAVSQDGAEDDCKRFICRGLPGAVLISHTNCNLKYGVPADSIDTLSQFLLGTEGFCGGPSKCPIKEWGVSQTTLEEVFLRVCEGAGELHAVSPAPRSASSRPSS